jgi:excisionase family DNA binding protein
MLTDGDDLDSAYFVVREYVSCLGPDAKLPAQVADWCLKVCVAWEMPASGPFTQESTASSKVSYNVAEAAAEMHVTERHVRRLAQTGDIDAEKRGRDWLIPQQAVADYMEGKWSKSTRTSN